MQNFAVISAFVFHSSVLCPDTFLSRPFIQYLPLLSDSKRYTLIKQHPELRRTPGSKGSCNCTSPLEAVLIPELYCSQFCDLLYRAVCVVSDTEQTACARQRCCSTSVNTTVLHGTFTFSPYNVRSSGLISLQHSVCYFAVENSFESFLQICYSKQQ